jgi:hypothetical protein
MRCAKAMAVFALTIAGGGDARACLNSVRRVQVSAKQVARAEQLIDERKYRDALAIVGTGFARKGGGVDGHLLFMQDMIVHVGPSDAINRRIRILRAVASMRADREAHEPNADYDGYANELHALRSGKDDPLVAAREAEALAAAGKLVGAREILDDLAARDLVPDAEAWATLADVAAQRGDAARMNEAIEACKKIAKRANVCESAGDTTAKK